jgi:putative SbcD/Mre11-related phosphoesterase
MALEPVHGEPAAVATADGERLLLVADYHAGLEVGLRSEGVELRSRATERREHLLGLVESVAPDRLVVLGDLGHAIGDPYREEREELEALLSAIAVPITVAKGNHDGDIEGPLRELPGDVTLTPTHGARLGELGVVHGHTWPSPAVLESEIVCVGHEHPVVRLEDEVGGHRIERVWLRGNLAATPFDAFHDASLDVDGELVVFPAFNDLSGGTWINVEGQEFLAPFLPQGLDGGEAYLLDGTRLGPYRGI